MGATKFFNMMLPFETYQDLKRISIRQERPISAIIRQGIDLVLKNPSCKCEDKRNDSNN